MYEDMYIFVHIFACIGTFTRNVVFLALCGHLNRDATFQKVHDLADGSANKIGAEIITM